MYDTPLERAERIHVVNTHELPPEKIAKKVLDILSPVINSHEFSVWDIVCFCTWYLAYAIPKETPFIYNILKSLGFYVQEFHYFGNKWEWEKDVNQGTTKG